MSSNKIMSNNTSVHLIEGQLIAKPMLDSLCKQVQSELQSRGVVPGIAVILVGDNPASQIYVNNKVMLAKNLGFRSSLEALPSDTNESDLIELIQRYNNNTDFHGILIQLPLPKSMNSLKVLNSVSPEKDVDGLHSSNFGRMAMDLPALYPCTALAVLDCIESCVDTVNGLDVAIIGMSNLVGKPLSLLLGSMGATVSMCHKGTKDVKYYTRHADIVVVAVGIPGYITSDFLKDGSIVIDVGITRVGDSVRGDVDFENVVSSSRVLGVTPVPGGVGPLTVARLMLNTYEAMRNSLDRV